jgi:hypothetical protein
MSFGTRMQSLTKFSAIENENGVRDYQNGQLKLDARCVIGRRPLSQCAVGRLSETTSFEALRASTSVQAKALHLSVVFVLNFFSNLSAVEANHAAATGATCITLILTRSHRREPRTNAL